MEHLDSLAGSISYKHMLGPGVDSLGKIEDRGFYIVTASVDRCSQPQPLELIELTRGCSDWICCLLSILRATCV
jgi:hypothetical protein